MSILKLFLPLSKKKKEDLNNISKYIDEKEYKRIRKLLKLEKVGISYLSLKVSKKIIQDQLFPVINPAVEDKEIIKISKVWNSIIQEKVREKKYEEFSLVAEQKIKEFIAPHIIGLDDVKEAVMLQLFATDKIHVLLLGDPGTGKTDILRAVDELAPISSYGLGSGTSGVGLTAALQGKEVAKGLLPMADNGICCVDELNLMKTKDRGSLLNAMEKGFVTYDKGSKHVKFDARISLLATANPKGDKFVGKNPDIWLKQIPFDTALLSRFHMVFFVRRPGQKEFVDIAKKIVNEREKNLDVGDSLFIRDYIEFSHLVEVGFDEKLKTQIVEFAAKLKKDEKDFLVEISPRIVLGIMRLTKASARLELRRVVEQKDLNRVFKIVKNSLYIK
ncbi:MAG: ATP-binding protein [Nanoarchaeota archaeon]|nr:ATP-binding protein [Nanoarchaeota archaeon]MBU1269228.1 ATP-binding protein [Nanoarchaeota archaeon]MBU1603854.1 ATP-binding protein [Nanoarchaeota archaeon]MBU2442706.1 ATP-binding protein [Nanoarchaeota archaeon]